MTTALGGLAQFLAPTPTVDSPAAFEPADQKPSFLFNGPVNTSAQGSVIPVVYGTMLCGSVVVASGIETEDLPV